MSAQNLLDGFFTVGLLVVICYLFFIATGGGGYDD
jgi:hypothetical protein